MMAENGNAARELLSRAFNPHIAVICSPEAHALCQKNNLTFSQLMSPFSTLTTSLYWHEPGGTQVSPRYLRITPMDLASWKPPRPDANRTRNNHVLQNRVAQTVPQFYPDNYVSHEHSSRLPYTAHKLGTLGLTREYSVEMASTTPWFDSWRTLFLQYQSEQQLSQHEFINHFIGCILVISSTEGKNAEELSVIIGKLSKLQQQHQTEWPNSWFLPSILKFYLILHDNSVGDQNVEVLYQSLRTTYTGNACYTLKINSGNELNKPILNVWSTVDQEENGSGSFRPEYKDLAGTEPVNILSNLPHPLSPNEEFEPFLENGLAGFEEDGKYNKNIIRGHFLTHEDIQNVQIAVNEFIAKALLPYVERQTRLLHESIVNRRSMSKSFFGATKRLFGTAPKSAANVVYGADSLEVTTRKLADLYFLCGHYSGAYQMYHQLKKDFQGDQAWLHYASTLEMAALSHFAMLQVDAPSVGARSFPAHYVSEAIRVYQENCRTPELAVRCALLAVECLKQLENYAEAATILISMTSEDSDIRSALMLEQAAYSFLKLNSPRKYALHSVLAGNRYGKAGLRMHSLNAYFAAAQIYYGRGWRFAEDHVFLTIAKHQSTLGLRRGLAQHLKTLMRTPSPQPESQLELHYNEFLGMMMKLHQGGGVVEEIFIPTVVTAEITVRVGKVDLAVGEIEEIKAEEGLLTTWDTLEEQVVKSCVLEHSLTKFKPSRLVFEKRTNNTVHPSVPANEFLYIEVPLHNSLSVPLTLQNINLKFEPGTTVTCSTVKELRIEPNSTKIIRFSVVSSKRGRITYEWLRYDLTSGSLSCQFQQRIHTKGPRLNGTKVEKCSRTYAKDFRNEINVMEQMPLIQAEIEDLPETIWHSQLTPFTLTLCDKSKDPHEWNRVHRVILASEGMMDCLQVNGSSSYDVETPTRNYTAIKLGSEITSTSTSKMVRIPVEFKAPQGGDTATLRILVVYQVSKRSEDHVHSTTPPSSTKLEWEPSHRVTQVSIKVPLSPCLRLEYSFLKKLDSVRHLALVKIYNLTEAQELNLCGFEFVPSTFVVEKLISREKFTEKNPVFVVGPAERRSIAMEVTDCDSPEGQHGSLFLFLTWVMPLHPRITGRYRLTLKKTEEGFQRKTGSQFQPYPVSLLKS